MKRKLVSLAIVLAMLLSLLPPFGLTEVASAATLAGNYVQTENQGNWFFTDVELDTRLHPLNIFSYPIDRTFRLNADQMPQESCYLAIRTNNVNWHEDEYNEVSVNGHSIGGAGGMRGQYNITILPVPLAYLKEGDNLIKVLSKSKVPGMKWTEPGAVSDSCSLFHFVYVDWIQLICDGGTDRENSFEIGITGGSALDVGKKEKEIQISVASKLPEGKKGYKTEYSVTDPFGNVVGAYYGAISKDNPEDITISLAPEYSMYRTVWGYDFPNSKWEWKDGTYTITGMLLDGDAIRGTSTTTFQVENSEPVLGPQVSHEITPTEWSGEVTVTVTADTAKAPIKCSNFQFTGMTQTDLGSGKYSCTKAVHTNGTYDFPYTYSDWTGNTHSGSYTVEVSNADNMAPVISYNGKAVTEDTYTLIVPEDTEQASVTQLIQSGLSAEDAWSGLADGPTYTPSFNTHKPGSYPFDVTAKDHAGNERKITFKVQVDPLPLKMENTEFSEPAGKFSFTSKLTYPGPEDITETGFVYGPVQNPAVDATGCATVPTNGGVVKTKDGEMSASVSKDDLVPGIYYYARAYAKAGGKYMYAPQTGSFLIPASGCGKISVEDAEENTFRVTWTGTVKREYTVHYRTVSGSAVAGTHFTAKSGTLTFGPGYEDTQTVTVNGINASNAYGGKNATMFTSKDCGRTFSLELSRPTGGVEIGTASATKTLMPDAAHQVDPDYYKNFREGSISTEKYGPWTCSDTTKRGDASEMGAEKNWTAFGWNQVESDFTLRDIGMVDHKGQQVCYGRNDQWRKDYYDETASNIQFKVRLDASEEEDCYQFFKIQGHTDPNIYLTMRFEVVPGSKGSDTNIVMPFDHDSAVGDAGKTVKFTDSKSEEFKLLTQGGETFYEFHAPRAPANGMNFFFAAAGGDNVNKWTMNNLRLLLRPGDYTEPGVAGVEVAGDKYHPGEKFTVSVIFNEIVDHLDGAVSLSTNWGTAAYQSGVGTNVLYFTGTVPANNSSQESKLQVTGINGANNIKDMSPCDGDSGSTNVSKTFSNAVIPAIPDPTVTVGTLTKDADDQLSAKITADKNTKLEYAWTQNSAAPADGDWIPVMGTNITDPTVSAIPTQPGKWYLHARAINSINIKKTAVSNGVTVEPAPTLDVKQNSLGWAKSRTITVTKTPPAAVVTVEHLGQATVPETVSGGTYIATENGLYTFTASNGGKTVTQSVLVAGVDRDQPLLTLTQADGLVRDSSDSNTPAVKEGVGTLNTGFTVSGTVSDGLSGLKKVEYLFNSGASDLNSGTWHAVDCSDGSYTIGYPGSNAMPQYLHVKAVDNAGNETVLTSDGYKIAADETAAQAETETAKNEVKTALPSIALTAGPAHKAGDRNVVTLTWTVTNGNPDCIVTAGSTVYTGTADVDTNTEKSKAYKNSGMFDVTENGCYTVTVSNGKGHVAEAKCAVNALDNEAPTATVEADPAAEWTKNDVTVTLKNLTDQRTPQYDAAGNVTGYTGSSAGNITVEYQISGAATWTTIENGGGDPSFKAAKNGIYLIRLTDEKGNVATYSVNIKNIDKTAPSQPAVTYAYTSAPTSAVTGPHFNAAIRVTLTAGNDFGTEGTGIYSPVTFTYKLGSANAVTTDPVTRDAAGNYVTSFDISPEFDGKITGITAKDAAGNVSAAAAEQTVVVDAVKPAFAGVTSGGTYYTTQKVTLTEPHLDADTLIIKKGTATLSHADCVADNKDGTYTITLPGDCDASYTLNAKDLSGNTATELTITVETIDTLRGTIGTKDIDTVTSDDAAAISQMKTDAEAVLSNAAYKENITETEKAKLNSIIGDSVAMTARLNSVNGLLDTSTEKYTAAKNSTDITKLQASVKAIDDVLAYEGNLTETEKSTQDARRTEISAKLQTMLPLKIEVGGKTYYASTFAEIFEKYSGTPMTITVQENVAENPAIPAGRNVTVDLNGHKVIGDIANSGELTVTDQAGSGKICGTVENKTAGSRLTVGDGGAVEADETGKAAITNKAGGTVTVKGTGKVANTSGIAISNGTGVTGSGTVNLLGGTVSGGTGETAAVVNAAGGTVNLSGGSISNPSGGSGIRNSGTAKVNGQVTADILNKGELTVTSGGKLQGTLINNDDGATATLSGGTITGEVRNTKGTLCLDSGTVGGALTNDGTAYVGKGESGGTVAVGGKVTNNGTMTVQKNATLKGTPGTALVVENNKTLIVNGTIEGTVINAGAAAEMTVNTTGSIVGGDANTASVTNNGGTVSVNGNAQVKNIKGTAVANQSGTLSLTGGTVESGSADTPAIVNTDGAAMHLSGGSVSNTAGGTDIENSGTADVTGEVTADVLNKGELAITSGGKLTGALTNNAATASATLSGGTVSGNVNNTNGTVNLDSGTVTGALTNDGTVYTGKGETGGTVAVGGKVTNNGTMTVQKNATLKGTPGTALVVENNKTLIVNGTIEGTVINTGAAADLTVDTDGSIASGDATTPAVTNKGKGTVTITGGKVTNSSGIAIENQNAGSKVNLESGTIDGRVTNSGGCVTLNGGQLAGALDNQSGTAVIGSGNGGTPVSVTGAVSNAGHMTLQTGAALTGGTGKVPALSNASGATLDLKGGSVANGSAGRDIENKGTVNVQENTTTADIENDDDPAVINFTGGTLAGDVINTKGTVNLNKGTIDGKLTNASGSSVSADGSVTGAGPVAVSGGIENSGNLTISNNASLTGGSTETPAIHNMTDGQLHLEGGSISNTKADGRAVVNSGTAEVTGAMQADIENEKNLTVSNTGALTGDVNNNASGAVTDLNGGSITGAVTNTDGVMNINSGLITGAVRNDDVLQIGAESGGSTVTVTGGISSSGNMTVQKNAVLQGTVEGGQTAVKNEGTLQVDGTVTGTLHNSGTAAHTTISTTGSLHGGDTDTPAVSNSGGGRVTIDGNGRVTNQNGTAVSNSGSIDNTKSEITFNGGTVTGGGNKPAVTNADGGKLNFLGGSVLQNNGTDPAAAGTIRNDAETVISGSVAADVENRASLTIEQSGVLTGKLTNNGAAADATLSGGTVTGDVTNTQGKLHLEEGTVNGELSNASGAQVIMGTDGPETGKKVNVAGKITNDGAMTIEKNAAVQKNSTGGSAELANAGELRVDGVLTGSLTNHDGADTDITGTVDGTLTNNEGAVTDVDGGRVTGDTANNAGGTLHFSSGTLDGQLINSGTADVGVGEGGDTASVSGKVTNSGTGELTVGKNGALNGTLVNNSADATANVTGGVIGGGSGDTASVENKGKLHITGGRIQNEEGVAVNNAQNTSDISMTGGTVTGGSAKKPAISNEAGGSVSIGGTGEVKNETGTAVINSGTGSKTRVTGGTVTGGADVPALENNAELELAGGRIQSAQGTNIRNNGTAKVTGSASADMENNGSLTVDKTGVLTGNISNNSGADAEICGAVNGTLTNSSGASAALNGGTITGGSAKTPAVVNNGSLTLDGGAVNNEQGVDVQNDGTVNVTGATATDMENNSTLKVDQSGAVTGNIHNNAGADAEIMGTVNGSFINNAGASAALSGGKIISSDPAKPAAVNEGTMSISGGEIRNTAENGSGLQNQGSLHISGPAKVDIVNENDMTIDEGVTYTGNVTNQKNLTVRGTLDGSLTNASQATLAGGKITGDITNRPDAVLNLESGEVDGSITNSGTTHVGSEKGGTVLSGGKVTNHAGGSMDICGNSTLQGTGGGQAELSNEGTLEISGTVQGTVTNSGTGGQKSDGQLTVHAGGAIAGGDGEHPALTNTNGASASIEQGAAVKNETGTALTNGGTGPDGTLSSVKVNGGSIIGGDAAKPAVENQAGGRLDLENGSVANGSGPAISNSGVAEIGSAESNRPASVAGTVSNSGTGEMTIGANAALTGGSAGEPTLTNEGGLDLTGGSVSNPAGGTGVENNGTADVTGNIRADIKNSRDLDIGIGGSVSGDIANQGNLDADGDINGDLTNLGTASVGDSSAVTGAVTNGGSMDMAGAVTGSVSNSGSMDMTGSVNGPVTNSGSMDSSGTVNGSVDNTGSMGLTGTSNGPVSNTGDLDLGGTVNGPVTNSGDLTVSGAVKGPVSNSTASGKVEIGKNGSVTGGDSTTPAITNTNGGSVSVADGGKVKNTEGTAITNSGRNSTLNLGGDITGSGSQPAVENTAGGSTTVTRSGKISNNSGPVIRNSGSGSKLNISGSVTGGSDQPAISNSERAQLIVAEMGKVTNTTGAAIDNMGSGSLVTIDGLVTSKGDVHAITNRDGGELCITLTGKVENENGLAVLNSGEGTKSQCDGTLEGDISNEGGAKASYSGKALGRHLIKFWWIPVTGVSAAAIVYFGMRHRKGIPAKKKRGEE